MTRTCVQTDGDGDGVGMVDKALPDFERDVHRAVGGNTQEIDPNVHHVHVRRTDGMDLTSEPCECKEC